MAWELVLSPETPANKELMSDMVAILL